MKTISWERQDTSLPVTQSFPELEDMPELLQYQTLTLDKIDIERENGYYDIRGLKLHFKEGLETPLLRTRWARDNPDRLQQTSLDLLDSRITQVSVLITHHNYVISGIKFKFSTGAIVEKNFGGWSSSKWVTKDIPDGYQIVGMFVNDSYYNRFNLLGFNLLPIDRQFKP